MVLKIFHCSLLFNLEELLKIGYKKFRVTDISYILSILPVAIFQIFFYIYEYENLILNMTVTEMLIAMLFLMFLTVYSIL